MTSEAAAAAAAVLLVGLEGSALSHEERGFLSKWQPAGVTLFRRNLSERFRAVRALNDELQSTRAPDASPLIIAIDQEGGRVARLRQPFPDAGPAATLASGADDPPALAWLENHALMVGLGLRGLGFNLNFAPVLDVRDEHTSEAIGDRAFGSTPSSVVRRGSAFLEGLNASGVLACLKHFPGLGAARSDTHHESARVDRSASELSAWELVPFRELCPRAPAVMIAHAIYPQLAPEPASRAPRIIQHLLRGELGFAGAVLSDDMNMRAVSNDETDWQAAIVDTVAAGVDLLLVCRGLERAELALEALRRAAEARPGFSARLLQAAERVARLRAQLPAPAAQL